MMPMSHDDVKTKCNCLFSFLLTCFMVVILVRHTCDN